MRLRVKRYAIFRIGVKLTLPDETDVTGAIEALRETSLMLDSRPCLMMIGGVSVPLDRILSNGEEVGLYPVFSGG